MDNFGSLLKFAGIEQLQNHLEDNADMQLWLDEQQANQDWWDDFMRFTTEAQIGVAS